MKPASYDFKGDDAHYKGDTFAVDVQFNNLDVSSSSAVFTIKKNRSDTTFVYQDTYTPTYDGTNSTITLNIPSTNTSLASGKYDYDLQLTTGSTVETYLTGVFSITEDVTD